MLLDPLTSILYSLVAVGARLFFFCFVAARFLTFIVLFTSPPLISLTLLAANAYAPGHQELYPLDFAHPSLLLSQFFLLLLPLHFNAEGKRSEVGACDPEKYAGGAILGR